MGTNVHLQQALVSAPQIIRSLGKKSNETLFCFCSFSNIFQLLHPSITVLKFLYKNTNANLELFKKNTFLFFIIIFLRFCSKSCCIDSVQTAVIEAAVWRVLGHVYDEVKTKNEHRANLIKQCQTHPIQIGYSHGTRILTKYFVLDCTVQSCERKKKFI